MRINCLTAAALVVMAAGCSRVVQETIRIEDKSVRVPVPGDTVQFTAPSTDLDIEYEAPAVEIPPPEEPALNEAAPPANHPPLRAVRARLDTTLGLTTLHIVYEYPADRWKVAVERRDSSVSYKSTDTSGTRIEWRDVEVVPLWGYIMMAMAIVMVVWAIIDRARRPQ